MINEHRNAGFWTRVLPACQTPKMPFWGKIKIKNKGQYVTATLGFNFHANKIVSRTLKLSPDRKQYSVTSHSRFFLFTCLPVSQALIQDLVTRFVRGKGKLRDNIVSSRNPRDACERAGESISRRVLSPLPTTTGLGGMRGLRWTCLDLKVGGRTSMWYGYLN